MDFWNVASGEEGNLEVSYGQTLVTYDRLEIVQEGDQPVLTLTIRDFRFFMPSIGEIRVILMPFSGAVEPRVSGFPGSFARVE